MSNFPGDWMYPSQSFVHKFSMKKGANHQTMQNRLERCLLLSHVLTPHHGRKILHTHVIGFGSSLTEYVEKRSSVMLSLQIVNEVILMGDKFKLDWEILSKSHKSFRGTRERDFGGAVALFVNNVWADSLTVWETLPARTESKITLLTSTYWSHSYSGREHMVKPSKRLLSSVGKN